MMSAGLTMRPCARAMPAIMRKNAKSRSVKRLERILITESFLSRRLPSKCWRRVDPQHPGFLAPRILPAVRNRAFKIKTIAGFQPVMLAWIQPNFKIAAEHMQKFFSLVRIGFTASAARFHPKKVRFHRRVSPGKQFHADVGRGFQNFSFRRPDQALSFTRRLEKREYVRAIELGDTAKGCDRRTHLAALERAQKADGNAGCFGDLRERKPAFDSEPPKTLARGKRSFRARRHHPLRSEERRVGKEGRCGGRREDSEQK